MNVALTGATGFLGRALLPLARQRAAALRVLVRSEAAARDLSAYGAHVHRGDLADPDSLCGFVQPGDVVIHAAARVDLIGAWADFARDTVATTQHLLAAALPARPTRFVYVSSASVYAGPDAAGMCADRTAARPIKSNFYGRAKLAAERLVQGACTRAGCPWTIVRLAFLYGPDNRMLHERLRLLHTRHRLAIIGDGQNLIALLYIADAAEAVWAAASHPAGAGKIYDAATAEPVTQERFLCEHARALGLPAIKRRVPVPLAYLGGWLAEGLGRLLRVTPAMNRASVLLMSANQVVDARRLCDETGWRPHVNFADGIQRVRAAAQPAVPA